MKYPKYTDYEKIYKRYLEKGVQYLIERADLKASDKVLDICGGNGRLTKEILKKCRNVSYLDKEADMIPSELKELGVTVYQEEIENFVKHTKEKYDKVFCEQAINYWLFNIDMESFSHIFEKKGLFLFNTFAHQPDVKPSIKEYVIEGVQYLEISYLVNHKVEHIQIREGFQPHFTEFDWISKEQYMELLSPYFKVEVIENGRSLLYQCERK